MVSVTISQDSIPVGCIPLAWKLYVFQFQLLPLDITPGGGYHDQMSLVGVGITLDITSREVGIPEGVGIGRVSQRGAWGIPGVGTLPIP